MDRRTFCALLAALVACGRAPDVEAPPAAVVDPDSTFHRIYDDPVLRAEFEHFLVNIFHLYPEDRFHALITQATTAGGDDARIYALIAAELPHISPVASTLTHALPALIKQKKVMAGQMASFLGDTVDGYLEIGTTGRYVNPLSKRVAMKGPTWVLHSTAPTKDPTDIAERGQISQVGTFVPMGDYDPIAPTVADASLDVVSNLIGLHHAPPARLDGFVDGIRRVLRPGALLLLREHDAADEPRTALVTLAHDVFNVGTGLSWADNERELRHFRSVADWTTYLTGRGFQRVGSGQAQAGDPTHNQLLAFRTV